MLETHRPTFKKNFLEYLILNEVFWLSFHLVILFEKKYKLKEYN
jgi:hypothetical protein